MFDILALSDADRYAIWTKGIVKELAYVNYCNAEIKARFMTLRDAAMSTARRRNRVLLASIKETMQTGQKFKTNMIPINDPKEKTEFEEFEDELKSHMVKDIKNGEFIVLGYQSPRGINDAPKPVPLDVWDQHDPWHGNNFSLGATEITDVHITLKRSVASYFKASPPEPKAESEHIQAPEPQNIEVPLLQDPPKGRPTKAELIHRAFDLGIENELIDCSQSKKTIYSQVDQIIRTHWPEEYEAGKGLGDTPMRKYLADKIKAKLL